MNVVPLTHLFRTIQTLVNSTRFLLGCVAVVALLGAGAGISTTLLIAIAERTEEIGILRAIGASGFDIFRLFWVEIFLICIAGASLGMGSAFLFSDTIESWIRARLPFAPQGQMGHWDWRLAGMCLAVALSVGSVAGSPQRGERRTCRCGTDVSCPTTVERA